VLGVLEEGIPARRDEGLDCGRRGADVRPDAEIYLANGKQMRTLGPSIVSDTSPAALGLLPTKRSVLP